MLRPSAGPVDIGCLLFPVPKTKGKLIKAEIWVLPFTQQTNPDPMMNISVLHPKFDAARVAAIEKRGYKMLSLEPKYTEH